MKRLAIGLAALGVLGALPAVAPADLPGPAPNGRIVFTSGRDTADAVIDNTNSQLWLVDSFGNPGTATRFTTSLFDTSHHRHASWSPDHTKLTYARGPDDDNFNGPWSIIVHDVLLGSSITIANASNVQDRPAFSPDGTEIVYSRDTNDADATAAWVVETRPATGGAPTTVATGVDTAVSSQFTRPHWTPDGEFILYGKADGGDAHDIYRAPADGSDQAGDVVVDGVTNDYQPHVSPAGDNICFTRDTGGDKNVFVATITGGDPDPLATGADFDYECAWSPDTETILFTRGAFGAGAMMFRNSDASGVVDEIADAPSPAFDGNGDWAVNFSPECANITATVAVNGVVSVPLSCSDPDGVDTLDPEIASQPQNGVLGSVTDENTVFYTPNANFEGTDTFTFTANDGTSDSDPGTATITVGEDGGGGGTDPEINGLAVSPKRFKRGSALPQLSAATGTTISFNLNENASTRFSFSRQRPGRRAGGKCRKPTRRNRGNRRCKRFVRAGSFSVAANTGDNSVRFEGRLSSRKRLKLGRYRMTAQATDSDGNRSNRPRVSFRVTRR